jgi:hypothetical protein
VEMVEGISAVAPRAAKRCVVESPGTWTAAECGVVGCGVVVAIGVMLEAAGPDWPYMAEVSPPWTQSESGGINIMVAQRGGSRSRRQPSEQA